LSETTPTRQRLAAIMAADAVGYSRLMNLDEAGTVAALDAAREAFRVGIETHQGRVIDMAGDSVLAAFETATGAVSAALAVQGRLEAPVAGVPADRRMRFRIGVHLGDVMEKADGSIYGDGVNIAARLEGLALPGGVTVSDAVHSAVRHRVDADFEDLGDQQVKNIVDPVRVYRVSPKAAGQSTARSVAWTRGRGAWPRGPRTRRRLVAAVLLLVIVSALALALRGPAQELVARMQDLPGTTRPGEVAPVTMSLAVGAISTSADQAVPVGAGEALRQDLLGGIGSFERNIRIIDIASGSPQGDDRERVRQAGARYLVEGDLRASAGLANVGLRLIETQRGAQVWSSRFELPGQTASFEGAAARRRLVQQVAAAVENAETNRVLSKPLEQLDAMELVIKASSLYYQEQSEATAAEIRKLAERALNKNPNLVPALRMVAVAVDMHNDVDPHPDHERYVRETDELSSRAVTIDPRYAGAWSERAAALMLRGRWNASLEASQRAIDLDPYGSRVYQARAWLMIMMGRPAEALPFGERALALDPSQGWSLRVECEAYLLLGEHAKAITTCERASGLDRDFIHDSFLAAAYANAGDLERARAALQSMLKTVPGYSIAQLKAKRYSDHPEYQKLAERYWYGGLRKAGLTEQ
jgi:adenylate cyclase